MTARTIGDGRRAGPWRVPGAVVEGRLRWASRTALSRWSLEPVVPQFVLAEQVAAYANGLSEYFVI